MYQTKLIRNLQTQKMQSDKTSINQSESDLYDFAEKLFTNVLVKKIVLY